MKKRSFRRFLSVFLSVLILCASLPAAALAEAVNGGGISSSGGLDMELLSPEEIQASSLGELYAGTNTGTADGEAEAAPDEAALTEEESPAEPEAGDAEPGAGETETPEGAEPETEETGPEAPGSAKPEAGEAETEEPTAPEAGAAEAEAPVPEGTLAEGNWLYRLDAEGHAVICGYLGKRAESLTLPDSLGGAYVVGVAAGAFADLPALRRATLHGNIRAIGEGAFPADALLRAYHGAYALAYAEEAGLGSENLSEFHFAEGVVDYSDVAARRYAFAGDTRIRMRPLEASRLKKGSVFYLPASDKYPNGEGFVVESMETAGDWVALECRLARGAEIVTRVQFTVSDLQPDWENAVWAEGVTPLEGGGSAVAEEGVVQSGADGVQVVTEGLNRASVDFEETFGQEIGVNVNLGEGIKFYGNFDLSMTFSADADMNLNWGGLETELFKTEVQSLLKGTGGISAEVGKDWSLMNGGNKKTSGIPIARVPFVSVGIVDAYVDLEFKIEFKGTAETYIYISATYGTEWDKKAEAFRPINKTEKDFELLKFKASLSISLEAGIGIHVLFVGDVLELSAEFGIEISATAKLSRPSCMDLSTVFFVELELSSELFSMEGHVKLLYYETALPFLCGHLELHPKFGFFDPCTWDGEDGNSATYTVRFVTRTAQVIEAQQVAEGGLAEQPQIIPVRNNSFKGWHTGDGLAWDFGTSVTEDITLYAKWETSEGLLPGGGSIDNPFAPDPDDPEPDDPDPEPEPVTDPNAKWFTYELGSSSATITGLSAEALTQGYPLDLTTPVDVEGLPVTGISQGAFSYTHALRSLVVSHGVTFIGDNAFEYSDIESVDLPDSVVHVGILLFDYCDKLTSVKLPESLTAIESYMFTGCSSLDSIDIPDGVKRIGKYAFSACSNLMSIDIPDGVTSIEEGAFNACERLLSVDIPDGVTSIEDRMFDGCDSLISANLPHGVTSIGYRAFSGCVNLASIDIPNNVTNIGEEAFSSCRSLTSIDIPNGVTSIGNWTFYDCFNLASIDISDNVTNIGKAAFSFCSSLTSIDIPNGVVYIGSEAFSNCSSLKSIVIPNSVNTIASSAFAECDSLVSVKLSNKLTKIEAKTFSYCSSLSSINIPYGITAIEEAAFEYCTSLMFPEIPTSVMSIGESAFSHCDALTEVSLQYGFSYIYDWVFSYCGNENSGLDIYIPERVYHIEEHAFYDSYVTIHGVPGSYAETYAKEQNIPFVSIGTESLHVKFFAEDTVYPQLFIGYGEQIPRPADPIRSGYTFTGWYSDAYCTKRFLDFDNGVMPEDEVIMYTANSLTLYAGWRTADGDMSFTELPDGTLMLTAYTGGFSRFSVPEESGGKAVTAIGAAAFELSAPTRISIPASVATIEEGAFAYLRDLQEIELEEGNTAFKVADGALLSADGTRLLRYPPRQSGSSYSLPDGVTSIDPYAFYGAAYLEEVTLPAGLASIGDSAFAYCAALTRLSFAADVAALGEGLFTGCTRALQLYGPVEDCALKTLAETHYIDYNLYPVEFYNGDAMYHTRRLRAGDLLPELEKPTNPPQVFAGWYRDSTLATPFDPETEAMPADTLRLYIKWGYDFSYSGTESLTVTGYGGTDSFLTIPEEMDGLPVTGVAAGALVSTEDRPLYEIVVPASVTDIADGAIQGLSATEKTAIVADADSAAEDYFNTYASAYNLTWQARQYDIYYEANGGKAPAAGKAARGAALTLPETQRDNYTFDGWYKDAGFAEAWDEAGDTMPGEPITLYAKWTVVDAAIPAPPFLYTAAEDGVTLHAYTGRGNFLTIPASINGDPVTKLGDYFLQGDTRVQRLVVPASVREIGKSAFQNSALQQVIVEEDADAMTLISIGASAFADCAYLSELTLGRNMAEIAPFLFANCTGLTELTLPGGIAAIGEAAFYGCAYLTSLTLPMGLTEIGGSAFAECGDLRNLRFMGNLPTGVNAAALRHTHPDLILLYDEGMTGWTSPTLSVGEDDGSTSVFRTAALGASGAYIRTLSANRKNAVVGDTLVWKGAAEGEGTWQYKFTLYLDEAQVASRAYAGGASYSYTAQEPGVYRLEMTARSGGVETAPRSCEVSVTQRTVAVRELSMAHAALQLDMGETRVLSVTVTPTNATAPTLLWSSSNENVVTVDANGRITARGMGSATVEAVSANGLRASCYVMVNYRIPPSIVISGAAGELYHCNSLQLAANFYNFDKNPGGVEWECETPDTAAVSAGGLVNLLKPGTVIITATANDGSGVMGRLELTVLAAKAGDTDKSGGATLADAVRIAREIVGYNVLDAYGRSAADVNRDGALNVADVTELCGCLVGSKTLSE